MYAPSSSSPDRLISFRRRTTRFVVGLVFAGLFLLIVPGIGRAESPDRAIRLLVKLRSTGPEAVTECAETLWRSGRSFRSAQRSGSGAIDAFHTRFHTRSVRALFRRPDGGSFEAQRETLAARGLRLAESTTRRRGDFAESVGRRDPRSPSSSVELSSRMANLSHIYLFELPERTDFEEAITALRNSPGVEYVQADHVYALDQLPDDPFLFSQGAWGQPYGDLWGLHRIRALEAWRVSQGEGVVIAIVDTGLDTAHPDIAANVWVNPGEDLNGNGRADPEEWNGIDDDANGFVDDLTGWNFVGFGDLLPNGEVFTGHPDPFDDVGHGTHVAGIAAAVGGNALGIAGVAPAARVMPLKGFPAEGAGRDTDLWRAVLYAIEQGARVVNASWSCSPHCPENPLAEEVLALAEAAGVVFVTSAGNESSDVVVNAPENTRAAITVGSIGFDDEISSFSNRGWLVDIVAPGGGPHTPRDVLVARRNILSLLSSGTNPLELTFAVDEAYFRLAGTSMAAPFISGAVAVLLAKDPVLSPAEVRRLLRYSARDLGVPGHDVIYGAGALDLTSLLETTLPDLDLVLEEPTAGQILDPQSGPIEIVGRASGADRISHSIAFARGLEGGAFVEIEVDEGMDGVAGVLASWDAAELRDGPVVIRLRAELRNGRIVDEFAVFSLERNRPMRLSQGQEHEGEPSISGNTVVWRTMRGGFARVDVVRLGGFDRKGNPIVPRVLHQSDHKQHRAIASSGRVVWLETDPDTLGHRLMGCRIGRVPSRRDDERSRGGCRAVRLAESSGRFDPIRFARDRVIWSPRIENLFSVISCRLRGARRCVARGLPTDAPPSEGVRLLDFDGRSVLWSTGLRGSRIEICRFATEGDRCEPIPLAIPTHALPVESASLDGTRLVVASFRVGGSLLLHCEVDLVTGACDLRPIGMGERGKTPTVSGERIAWERVVDGEPPSIAFCEVDPIDGECWPQQVTGGLTPGTAPSLDANHLVWQDDRFGPTQVLGTELPSLWTRSLLRVMPGGRRISWIISRDPEGGPLALRLEGVDGLRPEQVGARFEVGDGQRTRLVLEPPPGVHGRGRWRLIGRARGGWTTRRSIVVDVQRAPGSGLRSLMNPTQPNRL